MPGKCCQLRPTWRGFFFYYSRTEFPKNVTVLCFDFCDYETFVLLFPLLCVCVCGLINQSCWGGAGNYACSVGVVASDAR